MTNQKTTAIAVVNTLEAEGEALAGLWKNICSADKKRFTKATKADGFDTRLGKLMLKLKAESDAGRISSARLKECHIHSIDKRRRSEALWFVENETACRSFIQASKKGFTSLTALQSAMRKADKSAKADEQPEADTESNVGPTESETQEQSVNELDIVIMVMEQCGKHHIAVDKVLELLQSEVDNTNQKAVA
tara:strand:+ start:1263 stop:1838 length:576 start_codon:yes stop_codon:yes gene_type:complete